MGFAVRAFNEAPGQGRRPVIGLRVVSRQISAADLIRSWVDLALAEHKEADALERAARHAHPDELVLHPARFASAQAAAHARAIAAFTSGKILLLVDDRQIEGAEALIGLTNDTEVTFLRLAPLKGG